VPGGRTRDQRNDTRWGWHQLDSRWVSRLVAAADVGPGDLVLDVGAGTGAVTAQLLRRGASVVAIELHPRRLHELRKRFAGLPVTVVRADAADLRLPRRPFKVVANPPFASTTALLRRLTGPSSRLDRAALVLPAYAEARWAAGRGAGTAGSAGSAGTFTFVRGPRVPANALRPAPPKDPAILLIRRSGATRRGGVDGASSRAGADLTS
jgi:23S rRNA (adenine-N6)-dimethyltransferase